MNITKLTREEARVLYTRATRAMKCNATGSVTFEVYETGIPMIAKAIPMTNTYTMSDRSEWNPDLFTSSDTTIGHTILK